MICVLVMEHIIMPSDFSFLNYKYPANQPRNIKYVICIYNTTEYDITMTTDYYSSQ